MASPAPSGWRRVGDSQKRMEQMTERLKEAGLRLTPQRLAVLRILASSKAHDSIEQIYEQVRSDFPTTSLATIYKTVSLLKSMAVILTRASRNRPSIYIRKWELFTSTSSPPTMCENMSGDIKPFNSLIF